jgi:transcriptional regulator with XRE-family HTH domain
MRKNNPDLEKEVVRLYKETDGDFEKVKSTHSLTKDQLKYILRKHGVYQAWAHISKYPSQEDTPALPALRFSQNLVYHMSSKQVDSHELAQLLKVTLNYMNAILSGRKSPTVTEICTLSVRLGVHPGALFDAQMVAEVQAAYGSTPKD